MRVMHINQRAGFYGGVEQILFDTAQGLGQQGWPQAILHQDAEADSDYLAVFEQASSSMSIMESFDPDVLFLHKFPDADTIRHLSERKTTVCMAHDHDLVCMRRHKYFPMNTRVCDRPAGIDCYTHLCFVQKSKPGSRLPITLKSVAQQKRFIRAHEAIRRFMVGSRWMQQELVMNGIPEHRIEIVPPIPAALGEIGSHPPSDSPEILFVGQVIRGKGVDLLIRALADVGGAWHATIVGTGHHLEECKQLARQLGIDNQVHFAGWISHHELAPIYSRAALTVVPSRWPEPFGMVGIEAMARGRPVVGFAVGGIPDWLENNVTGFLVPEADTGAMASAIQRLLDDPRLRARFGQAAVQRVKEHYQPQNYLKQITQILENAE